MKDCVLTRLYEVRFSSKYSFSHQFHPNPIPCFLKVIQLICKRCVCDYTCDWNASVSKSYMTLSCNFFQRSWASPGLMTTSFFRTGFGNSITHAFLKWLFIGWIFLPPDVMKKSALSTTFSQLSGPYSIY